MMRMRMRMRMRMMMMMMVRRRRRMRMRMRMMIGYTLGTRMGHLYIALQCLGRTPGMFFGVGEGSHFPKMLCFHQEGGGGESPMFHDFGICLHNF
jgi:cyanate permease